MDVLPIALERLLDRRNRIPLLAVSAAMIATIAVVDWWTRPYVSLGLLYLFPIMLAAGFLTRFSLVALAILCGLFSEAFSSLDPTWRVTRVTFETLALVGCGLFVSELIRNRRLTSEMQQRLRGLVETNPAAIIAVDKRGIIELANQGAAELLAPVKAGLIGQPIGAFVPELQTALRLNGGIQFRTAMQCLVRRGDGETFDAEAWVSTYQEKGATKLTAIISNAPEEQGQEEISVDTAKTAVAERPVLNSRQAAILRLVCEGLPNNQIAIRLGVTPSVVRNTLQQIFAKIRVKNRSQMVRVALERYGDLL